MRGPSIPGRSIVLALALGLLLSGSLAYAQQSNYSLSWVTVTGGGASSGGSYTMVATLAQPEVSTATSGGVYSLVGGVWNVGLVSACPLDMDGDGQVTVLDIQNVASRWLAEAASGPPYDTRYDVSPPGAPDGVINIADIQVFASAFMTCPEIP